MVDTLRALPSVHQLLEEQPAGALIAEHGRPLVRFAVQRVLEAERRRGAIAETAARWSAVEQVIGELRRPRLRPVVNATGVILHTNLGRAPLAAVAAPRPAGVAGGTIWPPTCCDICRARKGRGLSITARRRCS